MDLKQELIDRLGVPDNWDKYDYQTQRYSFDDMQEVLEDIVKKLTIPVVTASYFESIQKGFKMLQQDCTTVSLVGFCPKEEIPDEATREDYEKEDFDHEYQLTQTDGWDEANFWGDIYLPLTEDTYMRFQVHG